MSRYLPKYVINYFAHKATVAIGGLTEHRSFFGKIQYGHAENAFERLLTIVRYTTYLRGGIPLIINEYIVSTGLCIAHGMEQGVSMSHDLI